jgi:glycerol-3-phosphate dehydrogenase (NAD(P)+)
VNVAARGVTALPVAVLGSGAWGTAIACTLAGRHAVRLWSRDPLQAGALATGRVNARYLPGITLPPSLAVETDLAACLTHCRDGLLLIATPTAGLRPLLQSLRKTALPLPPFVWLCKGFERATGRLAHEIVAAELPAACAGPLSGPSFATEVARGLPAALTVAGGEALCEVATAVLHGGALRIYATDDVVGVEVGGAVKNVLAIATGIADALGLGANARAALVTRGLAEITRFGVALGARADTFVGLSGLGDLVLTCTGALSRNRQVGLLLGEGLPLAEALRRVDHVAEGVWTAPEVAARAAAAQVEMPLTQAVCAVLDGRLAPEAALERLLARDPRREQSR